MVRVEPLTLVWELASGSSALALLAFTVQAAVVQQSVQRANDARQAQGFAVRLPGFPGQSIAVVAFRAHLDELDLAVEILADEAMRLRG